MDGSSPKRRRTSASPSTQQSPSRRPRRPSYASPTRASMSRHQPQILERREQQSQGTAQAPQPVYRRGGILAPPEPNQPPTSRVVASGAVRDDDHDDQSQDEQEVEERSHAQPSIATDSRAQSFLPQQTSTRSPRPNPRPFPPPASDEDELPTFATRPTRTSPNTGIPTRAPQQEPELPPARPDPSLSSPPKGIHSSPSRWRGKQRTTPKSSPLKQKPMRPDEDTEDTGAAIRLALNPRDENASMEPVADPARKVSTLDHAKKKERDELKEELAQLQKDLTTAARENERILKMQTAGRTVGPLDQDRLLDLLSRCLVPGDDILSQPPQSQQLVFAALNPSSLLPFSKPAAASATNKELGSLTKIKSHHPVIMSTEEELPYLQLFNPFDVTSSIAALPATPQHAVRQRRLLNLRSKDRPALFQARIEMVVNPMTLSIFELAVPALEPASRHELGPFVDLICTGKCNRSMQRNVGVLAWAMGEWHRVAVKRAHAWARLEKQLGTKDAVVQAATQLRRKRKQDELEVSSNIKVTGADLVRLAGKQTFDVVMDGRGQSTEAGQVRLEWKIGFDWTGEAESTLAVLIGVPGKWRRVDRRGSFNKLPGLFRDLVHGGEDVDTAARKVAALLIGVS